MGDWKNLYQDRSPDLPNVGLVGYGYLNNLIKSFIASSYYFQNFTNPFLQMTKKLDLLNTSRIKTYTLSLIILHCLVPKKGKNQRLENYHYYK